MGRRVTRRAVQYRPNSFFITIPSKFARQLELRPGQPVMLGLIDEQIVMVSEDDARYGVSAATRASRMTYSLMSKVPHGTPGLRELLGI